MIEQLQIKHEQDFIVQVEEELLSYKELIDDKINNYLKSLTETLLQRVGNYMQNILNETVNTYYLRGIILQEINQSFSNHELIVYANELTLEALKNELINIEAEVTYIVDPKLAANTCICENQFYKILVSTTDIHNKIQRIFCPQVSLDAAVPG